MNDIVERMLVVYDGTSEEVLTLIRLPRFDLNTFIERFDVDPETDPDMHKRYAVGPDEMHFILNHVDEDVEFDFQARAYFVEAVINDL